MPRQKQLSTENRQQEAQAMAAKHQSESLRSTRSAVSTRYCCSCVFMFKYFDVHTVIVIRACTTWGHIITHFWPTMTSVVMVLNLFTSDLYPASAQKTTQTQWQCDGQEGSIPVWRWYPHDGAAWEQPCFLSILPRYLMAVIFTAFDLAAYI